MKRALKWLSVQLLVFIALIVVIETFYFLLRKTAKKDCSEFNLPLKTIPFVKDSLLGYRNPSDTALLFKAMQYDGSIKEIQYIFDQRNWRNTLSNHEANKYALFVGCSFTFGFGLDNDEALPARFGARCADYRAYNFGAIGYSTSNILSALQHNLLRREVKEDSGICIYTFIDYHINRNMGNMSSVGNWAEDFPCYELEGDSVVYRGTFKTARPFRTLLHKLLSRSNFVRYYHLNFPKIKEDDIWLTAKIIRATADQYRTKFDNDNFYVLLYPNQYFDMKPYLEKVGVRYIYFNDLDFRSDQFRLRCDNHPSALAIDSLANRLCNVSQIRD